LIDHHSHAKLLTPDNHETENNPGTLLIMAGPHRSIYFQAQTLPLKSLLADLLEHLLLTKDSEVTP